MGSFFGNRFSSPLAFHDSAKAMFGAVSTFVLLITVCLIFVFEKPLFGQNQLTPTGLDYFIKGGAGIIAWLFLRASSEEIHSLFVMLARAMRIGGEDDTDYLDNRDIVPRRLRRIVTNLWIPVTLQFSLVWWLIYASGGLANSPYTSVLLAMMLIGQSVYPAAPIGLGSDPRLRDFFVFIGRMARYYAYPQLMFGSLLIGLALLQQYHPMVTRPAPAAQTIFVTQVSIFVSMCVLFITRRLDRTVAPGTRS